MFSKVIYPVTLGHNQVTIKGILACPWQGCPTSKKLLSPPCPPLPPRIGGQMSTVHSASGKQAVIGQFPGIFALDWYLDLSSEITHQPGQTQ
jgi:hypothetical protein